MARPALIAGMPACTDAYHDHLRGDPTAFAALEQLGTQPSYADPGEPDALVLANCDRCGSTLAREAYAVATVPLSAASLVATSEPPQLALVAGDRLRWGDALLRCVGEQNETWARYALLGDGTVVADNDRKWHARLVETCWLTRLLAICYAIAKAAAVDAPTGDVRELCELARCGRAA